MLLAHSRAGSLFFGRDAWSTLVRCRGTTSRADSRREGGGARRKTVWRDRLNLGLLRHDWRQRRTMKMKRMLERGIGGLLVLAMVLAMVPAFGVAARGRQKMAAHRGGGSVGRGMRAGKDESVLGLAKAAAGW